jgi:vitamin B12 transporter
MSFAIAGETDSEPLETGYDEHVSVTAARTPIPVDETGNSITILTREEIEQRGYVFLGDLLRGLPGLSISRSGPAGAQTQIRVRGAEANHVLVRIDGVDVSDAFGADELPLEMMTSYDIERIEFVRGPQSGLWGSDAVAGVINILTHSDRDPGGSARIDAGSFGTVHAGGRFGYGNDRLRFDGSISHVDTDGTNISRQGSEKDGTRNTTATTSLRYTPSTKPFDLELSARHTNSTSDFDAIDFVTTGLPVDASNATDTDLTLIQVTGRWRPEGGRWSHQGMLSSVGTDVQTVLGGIPDTSTKIDKLGASVQSSVDLGREGGPRGHGLTFAVDHEQRDFSQRGLALPFGDPNQDQEIDNTGVSLEYRFRSHERWAASANVRHDHNSDFDDITTFRLTGSVGLKGGKTRMRAAVGTGQKAPTFIERFGFFPNSFIGNPNLKPERSTGFEIGVDRQLGKSAMLGVTYFNDTLDNEINGFFFDAGLGGFTAVNESGESDREGLEVVFAAPLAERLDLQATYTYTDATQPDGAGDTERELRRPEHLASVSVNWRTAGNRLKLRGSLNHTGSATDLYFPPFPMPSQRVQLDSYVLADVQASFQMTQQFDLLGRVENLLDETYEDVFGFRTSGVGAYVGIAFRSGAR